MAKHHTAIVNPNFGLYFDRPSIAMSGKMLQDGLNFRLKEGKITNLNLGWNRFGTFTLNGAVTLITTFFIRGQDEKLIFGTNTDLYVYNPAGSGSVSYITPRYATGTASASGTAVTGIGTLWNANVKAGDEIHFGSATQNDPNAVWYTIQSRTNDTQLVLTASAGVIGAGVYTIRKKFTGTINNIWVSDTFVLAAASGKDEWWITNGVDDIMRWDGITATVEVMSVLNFKARTLRVYRNMMIFGGITQSGTSKPTDIINSHIGDPSNVSSGLAGQFRVHSGVDPILAMQPIGDALSIMSERTFTVAQFIDAPIVFAFRNAVSAVGLVAQRSWADYGDYHEFIGQDSYYRFDGATVREVNQHVWRDLIRQQDPLRTRRTYAHFDEENGDLIWSMPATIDPGAGVSTAGPSRAVVTHYLEQVPDTVPTPHSMRSFPFTAIGYYFRRDGITWDTLTGTWDQYNFRWNDQFFFSAFPLILTGDVNGKIYTINTSQDADGIALPSFVVFGRTALGDGRYRGLLSRVYPFVTQFASPLQVTAQLADHAMGSPTINHTVSFNQLLPAGGHFAVIYRRGRYYQLKFSTPGPGNPYEISGLDVDTHKGGKR